MLMIYDNEETKNFATEKENLIQEFTDKEHEESSDQRNDIKRDAYRRDYARVLYSSSFRRLQGKMQLLGINPTNFHRNRLTHSLEVAQIAGSIARYLELKNPVVVETCSLAHDLGNPPFGHAGERVLNSLANCIDYEGNAQTFRILRHLEKKHFNYAGLNLTLRTLLGVTKYFYRKGENPRKPSKFLYEEDYSFLDQKAKEMDFLDKKSIDAQIMDLSDEIAYAAHDLEDAISFGFMTVGEMIYEFKNSKEFKGASDIFNDIAKKSQYFASQANRMDTSEEYSFLLRKELTSQIVYELINNIEVVSEENVKQLGYTENYGKLAEGLKKLVFKALLRKKDVQLYEKQGERIIRGLFEVYIDPKFNDKFLLLPPEYRAIAEEEKSRDSEKEEVIKKRVVIDYIAGMMDSFAIQEYQRYFGASSLEKIYEKNV